MSSSGDGGSGASSGGGSQNYNKPNPPGTGGLNPAATNGPLQGGTPVGVAGGMGGSPVPSAGNGAASAALMRALQPAPNIYQPGSGIAVPEGGFNDPVASPAGMAET